MKWRVRPMGEISLKADLASPKRNAKNEGSMVMETHIQIQSTPNPNALKFILNVPIRTQGNVTFKNAADAQLVPLAKGLFNIENVREVYFYDNYITVTQDGNGDWDVLEGKIKSSISENINAHNPDFILQELKPAE